MRLTPPLPRIVQFSSGLFYSTSLNDEYTESKTGLLPEPRCLLSADALKKHLHCVCPWKWGLFARSGECLCIAQSPRKSGMRKYCELRVSSRLVSSPSLSLWCRLFSILRGVGVNKTETEAAQTSQPGRVLSPMAVRHLHERVMCALCI